VISNGDASADGRNGEADETVTEPTPELTQVDEATLIEERRRRREAIRQAMMKKNQDLDLNNSSSNAQTPTGVTPAESVTARSGTPNAGTVSTPRQESAPGTPGEIAVKSDEELANHTQGISVQDDQDGPSAADYDPRMDMEEDKQRDDQRHAADGASAVENTQSKLEDGGALLPDVDDHSEKVQSKSKELDMFASDDDDDDDMFAPERTDKPKLQASNRAVSALDTKEKTLLANWDDHEGYYIITPGEVIAKRYRIETTLGKGMFSSVVRALDETSNKLVAIKIIRNNETMKKAGLKEMDILQTLAKADPDDRKHLVRLESSFEHGGHLCMVFENLSINLREVLKKFGRDVGINLKAVRSYAQQMFLGLSLLRKCNILHADLKPDNILVNEGRNHLKICDLGSASDASDSEITPYLVSRFYRAPEIILGMHYDYAIDMWSIGCTLYELYTGKILFTGRTNNQMLRSIMECRGKFSMKMLKKAEFAGLHFDDNGIFRSIEKDKITNRDIVRTLNFVKPTRDLKSRLLGSTKGMADYEIKEVNLFIDLLERCLHLNPEKRCTPTEALRHPFISRPKG
jgi:serine/threonine-protein kinase PRP4